MDGVMGQSGHVSRVSRFARLGIEEGRADSIKTPLCAKRISGGWRAEAVDHF